MSNKIYTPCIHCMFWGILSSAVIVFTHTDSCLQPHPANIESSWLPSQCAITLKPTETSSLCIPQHLFPLSAFLTQVRKRPQPASYSRLWVDFAHFDRDNAHIKYPQWRRLRPAPQPIFFTSSPKKIVVTCLGCSNRHLSVCGVSCGVQDSIYIINPTSTSFLFHLLTLRLRHASPLALLTSPVGCLPTTSNLVSTIPRCFFSPGKSCPVQGLSITADKTTFAPEHTAKSLCKPQDNQLSGSRVQPRCSPAGLLSITSIWFDFPNQSPCKASFFDYCSRP